jgi:hypothetical protein
LISLFAEHGLSRELKTVSYAAAAAACALATADSNTALDLSLDPVRGTEHQDVTRAAEDAEITAERRRLHISVRDANRRSVQ